MCNMLYILVNLFYAICIFSSANAFSFQAVYTNWRINDRTEHTSERKASPHPLRMTSPFDLSDVRIMVNGMPGPMATASAEACLRKGLTLSPIAMTGPEILPCKITVTDTGSGKSCTVRLIPCTARHTEELQSAIEGIRTGLDDPDFKKLLAIDYTHPSSVNSNANFYANNSIPFVMGTTGGDREKLMNDMEEAGAFAVIAPNMAKQIVAMQAGLENLAREFPLAFSGYKLSVRESHQQKKADTSGTAVSVVESLVKLSGDDLFEVDDIEKIRNRRESQLFGVPEEHLNGHAYHTYSLDSKDGTVQFQLKHNVVGRTVYADGTADAVKFLARKVFEEREGHVYNMINVLQEGSMENCV